MTPIAFLRPVVDLTRPRIVEGLTAMPHCRVLEQESRQSLHQATVGVAGCCVSAPGQAV